jgi:DNA-binding NtrC family response regulator
VSPQHVSRIFVVDNKLLIASTLAAILQKSGFSARFFSSPLEALHAARWEAPDLLISDIMMPGISGIELAIQMKEQYPNCKVLLISGHPERGHNFHLLLKPAHPTEILSETRRAIASSHADVKREGMPAHGNDGGTQAERGSGTE